MKRVLLAAGLCAGLAQAADPLPAHDAAALLQSVADASTRYAYQGTFIVQHGERIQTLQVSNRPSTEGKESRLVGLDGEQREVRCTRGESVSIVGEGARARQERRVGNRHFPDILPPDAGRLVSWYDVRPGGTDRVAGLDCNVYSIVPKDQYRWGYVLCVDKNAQLPLKAALVDSRGRPLMQYTFADVRITPAAGAPAAARTAAMAMATASAAPRAIASGSVEVRQLPPGFARVIAVKRPIAGGRAEVEHWVFSDGLTHISMFVEPVASNTVNLRGASQRGMTNLRTLRVGNSQVTVVGDAPAPAVDMISNTLASR